MLNLTQEQVELLKKYDIKYDVDTIGELLINIDWVMTDYLDKDGEPTDDFKVLERLYDEIYDAD